MQNLSWEVDVSMFSYNVFHYDKCLYTSINFCFPQQNNTLVEPPVITKGFDSQTLQPGPSVYLKCIGKGNPTPEITWYLDEKKLINTDR